MTDVTYRRYTNLASLLHILRNRRLTLLSPETWDDKNDAFFLAEYKRIKELKTVLALCIAVREETYHHWQVFSHGRMAFVLSSTKSNSSLLSMLRVFVMASSRTSF
jgi:hypothetical protein